MPLSEKARLEVYIPDSPGSKYQEFLKNLEREFTHTFGGCTVLRVIDGSYLSKKGLLLNDRINLIYTDTPYTFRDNFAILSRYGEALRLAVYQALEEETVLVAMFGVYHAE